MNTRLNLVLSMVLGLLGACATSPGVAPGAAAGPGPDQILQACMQVEVPKALRRLGIDERIRTREDAGAFAFIGCRSVAANCSGRPEDPACRAQLQAYGLVAGSASVATIDRQLFAAANDGATQTVRRLLGDGANPNWSNAAGWTPLMIAAAERHLDTVMALLEAKADPNLRNGYGRTALMFAALYGQTEIAERLLDAGADVNIVPTDWSGWSALLGASARGHAKTVELLVRRGADVRVKAKDGKSAIDLARDGGHGEVVRLLEASARGSS